MRTPKRLALLTCSLFIFIAGCTNTNFGTLLAEYHYVEVRPPTTLWPPGTIVHVTRHDPLVLGVGCTADGFLGPNLLIKPSSSSSQDLARKASGTFSLDARYLETLKASGKYSDVEDIKLTFSNVSIFEVADETIFANLNNRTEACSKALSFRWTGRDEVSFVKSVLQADVIMQAKFSKETQLSASQKNAMLQSLAAELAINYSSSTNETMTGKSLYWGIRDEPRYAYMDRNGKLMAMVPDPIIELAAMEAAKQSGGTLVAYSSRNLASLSLISDTIGDSKPGHTIKGEVVRVENDGYFQLRADTGNVIRLHIDKTTISVKTPLKVKAGDYVEAKVDERGHAISFISDQPVSH